MKQSGRVSLLTLIAGASVLLVAALLLFSRESLTTVGARFMGALARGDVNTLTEMSFVGNRDKEQVRKDWEFAVNTAGRYYNFRYRILSSVQHDPKTASVRMQVIRDADNPSAYEENRQLPLVKVGDDWKVDVKGLSRDIYPGLPR